MTTRLSTVRGQRKKNKQTSKRQIIAHHNEMLGLELFVHDHLPPRIEKISFLPLDRSKQNRRQTFSRYCKTANAPARTTNVAPKAIPV